MRSQPSNIRDHFGHHNAQADIFGHFMTRRVDVTIASYVVETSHRVTAGRLLAEVEALRHFRRSRTRLCDYKSRRYHPYLSEVNENAWLEVTPNMSQKTRRTLAAAESAVS